MTRRCDLDLAHDLINHLTCAFYLDVSLDRYLDCYPDLVHAHGLARELADAHDLDHARKLDRKLALVLDRTRYRAHELALGRELDLTIDLDLARGHARELDRALDRARELVRELANRSVVLGASTESTVAACAMPGRAIWGVVGLAVRLLPVDQRPRYREEFGVELTDLPRRRRCGHALRLLAHAWELRRALVVAMRTADGEPARRAER